MTGFLVVLVLPWGLTIPLSRLAVMMVMGVVAVVARRLHGAPVGIRRGVRRFGLIW